MDEEKFIFLNSYFFEHISMISFLLKDERQRIEDHHNLLRRKIAKGEDTRGGQTSATNMKKIKYNKDLEVVAQR